MKKVLLVTALFSTAFSFGQSLTQANEPAIGESQSMFLCDSFANQYPNTTGAGVTWDYSNLAGYPGVSRLVSIDDATTTTHAASYPTSTKTIQVENSLTTYFNSTATERMSQGFVFNEPSFGEVIAVFDTDEQKLVDYPFSNGSSLTDGFAGTLDFELNGVPVNTAATGTGYAWIDGQGTLNLPQSTSYTDVIRYKLIDTSNTTVPLFGDLEVIRVQYEYYDINNSNLPVFTISSIKIQQPGGGVPLTERTMVLSIVEPTVQVSGIQDLKAFELIAYPNPAEDKLTIGGTFGGDAEAALFDQSGRLLLTTPVEHGTSIDLSAYDSGMYLLKVSSNGSEVTKTVVKR